MFFHVDFIYSIYWSLVPLCLWAWCPCDGSVSQGPAGTTVPLLRVSAVECCSGYVLPSAHGCGTPEILISVNSEILQNPRKWRPRGKGAFLQWHSPCVLALGKDRTNTAKSTWMPHTNFYFKLCFRAAVNNTTAHPAGSPCQDSTVAKCLHDTTPKSGYLFLKQFLIYKTDWKDVVLRPYEGHEPGGLLVESKSLHYLDQACKVLCIEQVKCVPRRQRDHNKD